MERSLSTDRIRSSLEALVAKLNDSLNQGRGKEAKEILSKIENKIDMVRSIDFDSLSEPQQEKLASVELLIESLTLVSTRERAEKLLLDEAEKEQTRLGERKLRLTLAAVRTTATMDTEDTGNLEELVTGARVVAASCNSTEADGLYKQILDAYVACKRADRGPDTDRPPSAMSSNSSNPVVVHAAIDTAAFPSLPTDRLQFSAWRSSMEKKFQLTGATPSQALLVLGDQRIVKEPHLRYIIESATDATEAFNKLERELLSPATVGQMLERRWSDVRQPGPEEIAEWCGRLRTDVIKLKDPRYSVYFTGFQAVRLAILSLPRAVAKEGLASLEKQPHNLDIVIDDVEFELQAEARLTRAKKAAGYNDDGKKPNREKKKHAAHVATTSESASAADQKDKPKEKLTCLSNDCSQFHRDPFACPKVLEMTHLQRREQVKKQKRCYRCGKGGHIAKKCGQTVVCTHEDCGKKHHTLLHRVEESSESSSQSTDLA